MTSLEPAAAALERGDEDGALRRLGNGILGKRAFQNLSQARRAQVRDNLMLEELRSEEALPRLAPELVASIRCPTLLLGGDQSPVLFSILLDSLYRLIPAAQRVTIPDASHLLHEDNPAAFHQAVESFLESEA